MVAWLVLIGIVLIPTAGFLLWSWRSSRNDVLCDELAFWRPDEASANPDIEVINAARPALATTQGPLVGISSPYGRRGFLWDSYKKFYGPEGDPSILIVQGASRDFNPSLPQSVVDAALKRDALANSAEYLGLFRTDVEALLTQEAIEAVTDPGIRERAPDLKNNYLAFVDPSGGSSELDDPRDLTPGRRNANLRPDPRGEASLQPGGCRRRVRNDHAALSR